ncbi:hypothetical protein [Nitrospirillum viridazoti]|uniref:hypothetical protein n=1 Tax=Nitrospirillum viridazoti TaxID=3144925 RepID=UPI0002D6CFB2|nr:hypothetical protein [Nitrospirillum amazonense]
MTGRLSLLGNGIISGNFTKYSVVQIGGAVLSNVWIAQSLDSFLNVRSTNDTTLYISKNWLAGRHIRALRTPAGDLYYTKLPFLLVAIGLVSVIGCIPIFGLGLLFLPSMLANTQYYFESLKFKAQGGIPIPL